MNQTSSPEQQAKPARKGKSRTGKGKSTQTSSAKDVVKTNLCIYGFGSAGVKVAHIASKELLKDPKQKKFNGKFNWLKIFALDCDGGFLRDQEKTHNSKRVISIPLRNEKGLANGAGAKTEEGEARANLMANTIDQHIARAKKNREIVILVGCAGGGSIGALKVFAEKFRAAQIRTIVILCKPEPYGSKYTEAFTEMRKKLLNIGVVLVPIENKFEFDEQTTPEQAYEQMNRKTVAPILISLAAVLQWIADLCNIDDSDLDNVFMPGSTAYVGVWAKEQAENNASSEAYADEIFNAVKNQKLQFAAEQIFNKATNGLTWSNGIKQYKVIHLVNKKVSELNKNLRVKPAINTGQKDEPVWFAFITSAKLEDSEPGEQEPAPQSEPAKIDEATPSMVAQTIVFAPAIQEQPIQTLTTTVYIQSPNKLEPRQVELPEHLHHAHENLTKTATPPSADEVSKLLSSITKHLIDTNQVSPAHHAVLSVRANDEIQNKRNALRAAAIPAAALNPSLATS